MMQQQLDALIAEFKAQRDDLSNRALQHAVELAGLREIVATQGAELNKLRKQIADNAAEVVNDGARV